MMNNNQSQSNMFCNTCKVAGKSQSEYSSHNTKTKNVKTGKVVVTCPIVLAAHCTYCNGTGHWKKYCKVLEKDEKTYKKDIQQQQQVKPRALVKPEQKMISNRFAALNADDDDDNNDVDDDVRGFEVKPVIITSGSTPATKSWASIVVAKPTPTQALKSILKIDEPKFLAKSGEVVLSKIRTRSIGVQDANEVSDIVFNMEKRVGYIRPPVVKQPVLKKSWADYNTDDESDGEDEE